jgi:hypothetical protein
MKRKLQPFTVRDCALVVIATGLSAQYLSELLHGLRDVVPASIYHHFWGRLLQPLFDEPEYNNDFASWAFRALHDKVLAERLSALDPTGFSDLEELRQELVEVVEARLSETEVPLWAPADQRFHFLRSQIVVFDTGIQVERPEQLADVITRLSAGSIFYHFIDARRRSETATDDFSSWLTGWGDGYAHLREELNAVDPYFSSLSYIQHKLSEICAHHGAGATS